MGDRVTVNFYHVDIPGPDPLWMMFDASGHVPITGDHVITPAGKRWTVIARTWQQHAAGTLHCNVVVDDYEALSVDEAERTAAKMPPSSFRGQLVRRARAAASREAPGVAAPEP